jgi:ankyrin repeat protein
MAHEKRPYIDISILLDMIALGQIETVETVLNESPGYDVNQKNKLGTFPALLAANQNNLRLLKLLVTHGARLDQKDASGRTVMGWAKKYDNQEMIDFIEKTLVSFPQKNSL